MPANRFNGHTDYGIGIGLRVPHYGHILGEKPVVDWFEIISETFMVDGGRPLRVLEQVRAKLPVILHGVSLSVGSANGLDSDHLVRLKALVDRIEPLWVSDHLCWTRTSAHNSHDLLPLPLTRAAMNVVCANIDRAQETLGRAMLFENPSSYLTFPEDEMAEWEFLAEMSRKTGCYLLLDINNIYVSACNHGFHPEAYLAGICSARAVARSATIASDAERSAIPASSISACTSSPHTQIAASSSPLMPSAAAKPV